MYSKRLEWKVERNPRWLGFSMNTNGKQCHRGRSSAFNRVDTYVDDVSNKVCASLLPLPRVDSEREWRAPPNINHTSIRLSSWHFAAIMNCETSVGKNAYIWEDRIHLRSIHSFFQIWLKAHRENIGESQEKKLKIGKQSLNFQFSFKTFARSKCDTSNSNFTGKEPQHSDLDCCR